MAFDENDYKQGNGEYGASKSYCPKCYAPIDRKTSTICTNCGYDVNNNQNYKSKPTIASTIMKVIAYAIFALIVLCVLIIAIVQ